MQNLTKIRLANTFAFFFRPNRIFSFDLRVAFIATSRLKNCHTSDTFSMVEIRLGRDQTFQLLFN